MEQLVDLEGVLDATVEANIADGIVVITVTLAGDDLDEASRRGVGIIRTAIHAVGGGTSGWDNGLVETGRQSELLDA